MSSNPLTKLHVHAFIGNYRFSVSANHQAGFLNHRGAGACRAGFHPGADTAHTSVFQDQIFYQQVLAQLCA